MSAIDYPDFLRGDQEVGAPFVNDHNVLLAPGTYNYGPYFCAGWESVTITASGFLPAGEGPTMVLSWFADQTGLQLVGQQTANCDAATQIADQFAVLGAWLQITVTWGTTGGGHATTLVVVPRRAMHGKARSIGDGSLIRFVNFAVGAGATTPLLAFASSSGRAHLHVASGLGTWDAKLQDIGNAAGIRSELAACFSTAAALVQDVDVVLPSSQVQVALHNTTGAAGTFSGSLVLDTSW